MVSEIPGAQYLQHTAAYFFELKKKYVSVHMHRAESEREQRGSEFLSVDLVSCRPSGA